MCGNNAIHTEDEIAVSIKEKEERKKKGFNDFFLGRYSRFCSVLSA